MLLRVVRIFMNQMLLVASNLYRKKNGWTTKYFFVKIVTEKSDMKYHPYSAAAFKLRRDVTDKTFKKIMQLWTVLHIRGFQIDDCVFQSSLNFVNLKCQLVL